ncbi:helix-turn-helix transcriptional regulator [Fibrella aquatilis]|uniref:WYL domain-containing protein n=1 Tax=Fibrella aquatilis TaxID=2817059 RepID=A0A939JZC8_9BACT|nr:WYL domain-containing protein [Fibrella aquatilis]MBO0933009.1 WYL domain-containing protein [Fibrella aquatilis]
MKDSAKLRRHLHIIQLTDKPYTYPSTSDLQQHLCDYDLEQTSKATLERDLKEIRGEYGVPIQYDYRKRGYYLALPADEDVDDFRGYVRLLERRERLETLTRSGRLVGHYLQLEQQDGFRGLDWLAPLWNALQRGLVVTFMYQNYTEPAARPRRIEPGLLFEYRNRWYVDGFDVEAGKGHRTFGLDRITQLELTTQRIQPKRGIDYRAARRHVIGVTAPPESEVERVVLRVEQAQIEYVKSLPLHGSQVILTESATQLTLALSVIINPELEIAILSFGEHVTVLEPASLREKISGRAQAMAARYGD